MTNPRRPLPKDAARPARFVVRGTDGLTFDGAVPDAHAAKRAEELARVMLHEDASAAPFDFAVWTAEAGRLALAGLKYGLANQDAADAERLARRDAISVFEPDDDEGEEPRTDGRTEYEREPAGSPEGGRFAAGGAGGPLHAKGEAGTGKGGGGPRYVAHPKSIDSLITNLVANGGFTYNPVTQDQPKSGFALSMFKDREKILDLKDVSKKVLAEYVVANWEALKQDGNHFGAWHDKVTPESPKASGKVFLDVSHVIEDHGDDREAWRVGQQNEQLAYFNLATFETVQLGTRDEATGKYTPKPRP